MKVLRTFLFLMTDNTCTGEYASETDREMGASQGGMVEMDKEGDFYCMRTALNEYTVFEDFIGEVHWDGQPLLAANWAIYKLIEVIRILRSIATILQNLFLRHSILSEVPMHHLSSGLILSWMKWEKMIILKEKRAILKKY